MSQVGRFIYSETRASTRAESWLLTRLDAAASAVFARLRDTDLGSMSLSRHNAGYLQSKVSRAYGSFQQHTYVLAAALAQCVRDREIGETTLVDYGGGTGFTAMIAKGAGVGRVIYVDRSKEAHDAARAIGRVVGFEADHYVLGEVESLAALATSRGLTVDALCSTDVLEHLHDVEVFYRQVAALPGDRLVTVSASGANAQNPMIVRRLHRVQRLVELQDGSVSAHGFEHLIDATSYSDRRAAIIASAEPGLDRMSVELLAHATRGLVADETRRVAHAFVGDGVRPAPPADAWETCDPDTGSWMERLLPANELADVIGELGFSVEVVPGWWGTSAGHTVRVGAGNAAKRAANLAVRLGAGLVLAPTYCVVAVRTRETPSATGRGRPEGTLGSRHSRLVTGE